ncbi:hypothetical protein C8R45DRAFT_947392 [Mycena sanguinolenta]|nr:hypothetical protein C8R45DRAFT_947392 [Mycena sanguinolenta]
MSTTIPSVDAITGALLIGTWASSLLYMAEVIQAVKYFRTFKEDNWKMKSYVAVTFAIDSISVVSDYACVYLYTITHAGPSAALPKLFLREVDSSERRSRISEQPELGSPYILGGHIPPIALTGNISARASFGGGYASAFTIMLFPAFMDRSKVLISGTVWMVTQASADLIIAGALLLELKKAKSLFKEERRFLINEETNIPVGILYTSGRVYVLSMLINLNFRHYSRSQNWTTHSGQRGTVRFPDGPTYNFTTVLFENRFLQESHTNNSGRAKSGILLPSLKATASTPETQPPAIEMVPSNAKQVPEFHPSYLRPIFLQEAHSRKSGRPKSIILATASIPETQSSEIEMVSTPAKQVPEFYSSANHYATTGPPEIQSPEIEMVPISAKQVPEA